MASVCRMVGVAHSCAFGVGGSSGIVRNSTISSGRGPVPMCVDPLGAHGSKTAARDDRWKIPLFQQEPASPYRGPSLPCATSKTTDARQVHPPRPALRSVRLSLAGPTSRHARRARGRKPHAAHRNHQHTADLRNRTDLGTGYDRFRGGSGPISTRVSTDLGAECDRSRQK